MFVKLISDVGVHKSGVVLDVTDSVARGYIDAGLAEESDAGAHLNAIVDARLAAVTAPINEALDKLTRSFAAGVPTNGPPSSGVHVEKTIEATESPADRGVDGKAIGRGLGEILGLLARTTPRSTSSDREHADKRLIEHYKLDRVHNSEGLSVSRAGTESMSGGTNYGYFIKPEILGNYFEIAMEESLIEPYAFQVPVGQTNEVSWPALDQYFAPGAGQSAATAGVQVFRKSEIQARQSSDAALRNIEFKITDLTGFTAVSRDLVADNYISAVTVLQNLFLKALNFKKDYEFLNGTGGDKPIGIRQSNALLSVTRALTNHVSYEDTVGMLAKFDQSRLKSAMWIAHQSCYTDLLSIKNAAGAYVFQPNALISQATMFSAISGTNTTNDLRFAANGTLHGLPIRFTSDKLEMLGTAGDFMLVDPSQYGVATRSGVEILASDQFLFNTDQIAYKWKLRNDGQSLWSGPRQSTTPSGSIFKTSPFVQIAT